MIERVASANWNGGARINAHPLYQMEFRAIGVDLRAFRASLPVIAAVAAAAGAALLQVAEAATVMLKALEKRKAFILSLFENQDVWGVN